MVCNVKILELSEAAMFSVCSTPGTELWNHLKIVFISFLRFSSLFLSLCMHMQSVIWNQMTAYVMQSSPPTMWIVRTKPYPSVLVASRGLFLLVIAFDVFFLKQAHKFQADLEIIMFLSSLPNARMIGFSIMPSYAEAW